MCDAVTHDAVHDTVHDAPSLEYRYPTLWNGGFIAEEYSQQFLMRSRPTWASQSLNGSALGDGMD